MGRIKGLVGAIAITAILTGGALASPAQVNEATQVKARTLAAHLYTSFIMARQVDREMMDNGLPLTDSMRQRLVVMDRELAGAERLAGSPVVAQGIANVRANVQKVAAGDADTVSLVSENVIKLYALGINGIMMDGISRLEVAATALENNDRNTATYQLQEAGRVLGEAHRLGGYHIQNDLDEIQSLLLEISGADSVPVSRDMVDERMAEVHEHLFALGQSS